jgi:hypothetical protein
MLLLSASTEVFAAVSEDGRLRVWDTVRRLQERQEKPTSD